LYGWGIKKFKKKKERKRKRNEVPSKCVKSRNLNTITSNSVLLFQSGIFCYVQFEENELSSPITISNSITRNRGYKSVLQVKSASYLDTGYYYCIVNGTTDFINFLDNVTHVYVYVKGKENKQILHFPPPLEREVPIIEPSIL
jgi:hypothetical protein